MSYELTIYTLATLVAVLLVVMIYLVDKIKNARRENNSGEWRPIIRAFYCSECGVMVKHKYKFCPNCGADMRSEE